jgi:hypothetical protein
VSEATEGKPSESAENWQYRGYRVFSDKVRTLAACEGKMEHNRSADDKAEMAMMTLRGARASGVDQLRGTRHPRSSNTNLSAITTRRAFLSALEFETSFLL